MKTHPAMPIRMTHSTALVLNALVAGHAYGFDIMEATGLAGGTVYPALRRLEAAGLAQARWEEPKVAQARRRPTRRYYEATAAGVRALERAAARYRILRHFPAAKATES